MRCAYKFIAYQNKTGIFSSKNVFFIRLFFFFFDFLGPAINPIVADSDEPLPSLSDWHDYEPNLEFDDTELTHPATTNGNYHLSTHI